MQALEARVCLKCYRRYRGARCSYRACPGYVKLWLRDQRTVFMAGMASYRGRSTMVTLTAPGKDRYPWNKRECTHAKGERCSGKKGCTVNQWDAAEWSLTAGKRQRLLLRAAYMYASRRVPKGEIPEVIAYVMQDQARGLLHSHIALGWTSRRGLAVYLDGLQRGVVAHDFGSQLHRGRVSEDPKALGTYMARYLDPAKVGESFVQVLSAVDRCDRGRRMEGHARSILRPVYVSPRACRRSGRTVGFERFKRQHWRKNGPRPVQEVFVAYVNFCGRRERREGWLREEMAVSEIAREPPANAMWVQEDLF